MTRPKGDRKDHLLVTLPKTIKWADYERELAVVADRQQIMWFRLPSMPTITINKSRCYILHDGIVKGWMLISEFRKCGFVCTTTGKKWPHGIYIGRTGEFHSVAPAKVLSFGLGYLRGFQGFRYFDESDFPPH